MKARRLFFALWPSDHVRQSIVKQSSSIIQGVKGRVIRPENIHITLHFIGQANKEDEACFHEAAQSVSGNPFTLNLDHYGSFARARVLWMGLRETPDKLIHLHDELGATLAACGYQCDKRPYNPHVTLMRKCTKPVIKQHEFYVSWPVDKFVLVESIQNVSGVNYRVIGQYPLS